MIKFIKTRMRVFLVFAILAIFSNAIYADDCSILELSIRFSKQSLDYLQAEAVKRNDNMMLKYINNLRSNSRHSNCQMLDKYFDSILVMFILKGDSEMAKFILSKQPDLINQTLDEYDNTALAISILGGNSEMAEFILSKQPDLINQTLDEHDNTALILASGKGCNKLKDLFGGSIEYDIIRECQFDMVKFLLDQGADINKRNKNGESALSVARDNAYHNIIRLLEKERLNQKRTDDSLGVNLENLVKLEL